MATGAPVPENFNVVVYPLAIDFDEGSGRNVTSFSDVDAVNFKTASYSNGSVNSWNMSGSGQGGYLGSSGIDFVTSGSIGGSEIDFGSAQYFEVGTGDLEVDVTSALSSSLANNLVNCGFRLAFSGTDETDSKTRFVKRFLSRQSSNKLLVPRILLTWDDTIKDRHLDLQFNVSSSLFLTNTVSGRRQNLISGSDGTELTGDECALLRFVSGSGTNSETTFTVNVSQHTGSTTGAGMTGVYSGTFNLSEFNTTFFGSTPRVRDEIELKEIWSTSDRTVSFYSGSITVKKQNRSISGFSNRRLNISTTNMLPEYKQGSKIVVRLFIEDLDKAYTEKAYKLPRRKDSLVVDKAYYRIIDEESGTVIVPFDQQTNSTRLSQDSEGMYISFLTAGMAKKRLYTIELLLLDNDVEKLFKLKDASFMVI